MTFPPVIQLSKKSTQEPQTPHFLLLEIDPSLLNQLDSFVLKGLEKDVACLCTQKHTFQLRQVLTSNTLLTLTKSQSPTELFNSYLELVPMLPKYDRLVDLLENYPYKGPIEEERMSVQLVILFFIKTVFFIKKIQYSIILF
jgi:hypothetical protein